MEVESNHLGNWQSPKTSHGIEWSSHMFLIANYVICFVGKGINLLFTWQQHFLPVTWHGHMAHIVYGTCHRVPIGTKHYHWLGREVPPFRCGRTSSVHSSVYAILVLVLVLYFLYFGDSKSLVLNQYIFTFLNGTHWQGNHWHVDKFRESWRTDMNRINRFPFFYYYFHSNMQMGDIGRLWIVIMAWWCCRSSCNGTHLPMVHCEFYYIRFFPTCNVGWW